jgi:PAS domain S-box-containing protein
VALLKGEVGSVAGDARGRATEPCFREATFVIGEHGVLEDVDAAAVALLGYTRDELVGQHGSMLVPRDAQPATAASIDRMARGEVTYRTGRLVRRDGTLVTVGVRSRVLPDGRLALLVRERPAD